MKNFNLNRIVSDVQQPVQFDQDPDTNKTNYIYNVSYYFLRYIYNRRNQLVILD